MKIIAYAYASDVHCPDCAAHDWLHSVLQGNPCTGQDEHTLPLDSTDIEGNPIVPIFSTDEQSAALYCSNCQEEIK